MVRMPVILASPVTTNSVVAPPITTSENVDTPEENTLPASNPLVILASPVTSNVLVGLVFLMPTLVVDGKTEFFKSVQF